MTSTVVQAQTLQKVAPFPLVPLSTTTFRVSQIRCRELCHALRVKKKHPGSKLPLVPFNQPLGPEFSAGLGDFGTSRRMSGAVGPRDVWLKNRPRFPQKFPVNSNPKKGARKKEDTFFVYTFRDWFEGTAW